MGMFLSFAGIIISVIVIYVLVEAATDDKNQAKAETSEQ